MAFFLPQKMPNLSLVDTQLFQYTGINAREMDILSYKNKSAEVHKQVEKERYKASNYNFVFPYEGEEEQDRNKKVLYNSRTNALALIEEEKYKIFENFCKTGAEIEDKELAESLKYGGYILKENLDELEIIRLGLMQSRYSTSSLGLTLAPTSDCNFRCIYCFEKKSIRNARMTDEVQEKVIEFVRQRANTISNLQVSWYGGEPMMALDIVEKLTQAFLEICEEYKIEYGAGIITNGFWLTKENVERLGKLKIGSIQVTLDGAPEEHNKRRPLAGGQPTFDRIIQNLKTVKDILPCPVLIRINTDKENIYQVDEVLRILKDNELDKVTMPYIAMVENSNDSYVDSSCYQSPEFSKLEFDFKQRHKMDMTQSYPGLVGNVCSADSIKGYVIDSDGKIYNCWDEIGMEEYCCGDLMGKAEGNFGEQLSYLMYDPTYDEECRDCKYLPICMGGCPHKRLYQPENRCTYMKYQLEEYMKIIAQQIRKRKSEEA